MLIAITFIQNITVIAIILLIAGGFIWYIKKKPGLSAAEKAIHEDYNIYIQDIIRRADPSNYKDFKEGIQEFTRVHKKRLPDHKVEHYRALLQDALDDIMRNYSMA